MAKDYLRSKRSLGQHFLKNNGIARRIVAALDPKPGDTIIEIGPGRGILTCHLIKSRTEVFGVEIDSDLVRYLKQKFPHPNLHIIRNNFLKVDLADYKKVKIIGNIPYQISTPIITKLIREKKWWRVAVLTFQNEFAKRLLARPKTKAYGALSVFFQFHLRGEYLFNIPSRFFSPKPKVHSKVLRIHPGRRSLNPDFENLVKMIFSKRRKMLRSILKGYEIPAYYKRKRPEELSLRSLLHLYGFISKTE